MAKQTHAVGGGEQDLTLGIREEDHVTGSPQATLTLLEYGDYECPDCMASSPVVDRLMAEFGDRLRFVFRHFPLTSVHARASIAAQAAEAAGAQGRFWEMHRLLYDSRGGLDPEDLDRMALRLDLEIYRFHGELTSGRFVGRIQRDIASGRASGVTGTPSFFVNGMRLKGRQYEDLRAALQQVDGR